MQIEETPTLATLLGRFRAAVGMTQEELAERAGISVEAVSALERGTRTRPRLYTVRRLAAALELPPDDLAAFEEAARAGDRQQTDDTLPVGEFLGARPATPLVGRTDEMATLTDVLDNAMAGLGRVLVLAGEAGAGKTRLLQEAMELALARGYALGWGSGSYIDERVPYTLLLQALSTVVERAPIGTQTEVRRAWTRLRRGMESPGEGSPTQELRRSEIVDAVASLLTRVGRQTPVVLLFDDIHQADPESLAAIECLSRHAGGIPVAVIAALRDTNLAEDAPQTARLVQTLGRERLADRLPVRRLSPDETSHLVSVLMGEHEVSDEFAGFVFRRTKGLPRLIHAFLRSLGGKLELQGEIGAGSMGRVFRALDRETGRTVAAKLVLARDEIDLQSLLRFQQEGALLARLDHPNIVRVYDTFVEEHVTCVVMELLEGESLGSLLRSGAVSPACAKEIGLQIAAALEHAHENRIVHRDIKPDNAMVLPGGQVKVTDFGIARLLGPGAPGLTAPGTIATTGMRMGTPLYMAPEQIAGRKIDNRTDIYALGALLYHLVTGRPPFAGADSLAVAVKHLQENPAPPSSVDPSVPPAWDAFIVRLMEKDPARRFQSAREVTQALATLDADPPARAKGAWLRTTVALVGALVVAAVALAFVVHRLPASKGGAGERMNRYLASLAARHQFSGSVAIVQGGKVLLNDGYGLADQQRGLRNSPNLVYPAPDLSPALTSIGVLWLENRGKLRNSAPICVYVNPCPGRWHGITTGMLLDGRSGIPQYQWGVPDRTIAGALRSLRTQPLDFSPGTRTAHTNGETLLMAIVIEKVSGTSWSTFMQRHVLRRAGMSHTRRLTGTGEATSPVRAYYGTTRSPGGWYSDVYTAASTASDVALLDRSLFAGKIIPPTLVASMTALRYPQPSLSPEVAGTRAGMGSWNSGTALGRRVLFTSNGYNGFSMVNLYFPRERTSVVVLRNDGRANDLHTALHLAGLAIPPRGTPGAASPPLPEGAVVRPGAHAIDRDLASGRFRGYMLLETGKETILSKGYGTESDQRKTYITVRTRWPLFGVNEFMVGVAVMRLQEEGKLTVKDRICKYLDTCPQSWRPITIEELLTDTSGMGPYDPFISPGGTDATMRACRRMSLVSTPGVQSPRSHCNPFLLSAILQRVTRQSWEDAMRDLVFRPAGMTDTSRIDRSALSTLVRGYRFGSPQAMANYAAYPMAYSTIADLERFDRALMAGRIISLSSLGAMTTPRLPDDPPANTVYTGYETYVMKPGEWGAHSLVAFQESSGDLDFGTEWGIRIDNNFSPATGSIWLYGTNDNDLFTNDDENALYPRVVQALKR